MHDLAAIWVLNFGVKIEVDFQRLFPKVQWIEFANNAKYFEAPSIQTIFSLSQRLYINGKESVEDVQILYLHTKGVSYSMQYQQIDDWRDMMLYFLIEGQKSCFHLLKSKKFDVLGTNYNSNPSYFSGNFWWASAKYIFSLSRPKLDSSKYDAELWVLNSSHTRIYVFHSSGISHAHDEYPREIYACQRYYKPDIKTSCDVGFTSNFCMGYNINRESK
jgi:hypothetical protein